jgi:hypothetical protein
LNKPSRDWNSVSGGMWRQCDQADAYFRSMVPVPPSASHYTRRRPRADMIAATSVDETGSPRWRNQTKVNKRQLEKRQPQPRTLSDDVEQIPSQEQQQLIRECEREELEPFRLAQHTQGAPGRSQPTRKQR